MLSLDNETVARWLAAVARGDEAAFKRLYEASSRTIYAFVLRRADDAALAEEVVVDTMLEVWKHPERFRGESKFSTWLLSIARHKLIDRQRAADPVAEDIDDHVDTLPSPDEGEASQQLAALQDRAGVERCMQGLSDEHRQALVLTYYEGLTVAEIGQVQQAPANTVKTRLFHARQKIRNCLAQLFGREDVHA
jgi:RNA polymerase sigma-70 factor, ECF subfamily